MPEMNVSKILVPVSGEGIDRDAISLACRMAKPIKGKVYVIYVIEVKRTLPLDAELAPEIETGERVLKEAERVAEELACDVQPELLQAREVGLAVVDEAVERTVDLVIMGVAGKKRFGDFDLGPAASYVLRNAPCGVWIMRAPTSP